MKWFALSLACFALPACQQFDARGSETFTVPAKDVKTIDCRTHNGRVTIVGVDGLEEIEVTAAKVAHASTQEEADENLAAMRVRRDVEDARLKLRLGYDQPKPMGWGGSVAYSIRAPKHLAAAIESHNGRLHVEGLSGWLQATSHNGRIHADGDFDEVTLETHNGRVEAVLHGEGAVDGSIETHNGSVDVAFATTRSTRVQASTHNGSLSAGEPIMVHDVGRRSMRATVGEGGGALSIETHNGSVSLRALEEPRPK